MEIVYKTSAEKELLKLGRQLGQRIFQKIALLQDNPYGQGSQKLGGGKGYRIRIGDYRVTYTVDKKSRVITIVRIRHRREVYREW